MTDRKPDAARAAAQDAASEYRGLGEPNPLWPDPTPEMLADPRWNAIWETIKTWDINVPAAYRGYCGANGNHARAIFDALWPEPARDAEAKPEPGTSCVCGEPWVRGTVHRAEGPCYRQPAPVNDAS